MSFLSQPLQDILIGPSRKIDSIAVQVVVNEDTNDTLTITKQPVQQGASITDHSFLEPTVLSMTLYFSGTSTLSFLPVSLKSIYEKFLTLQSTRTPFTITTPKRIYGSMLLASISQTTDKLTENVLKLDCKFQQVIIVPIATAFVLRSHQKTPAKTGATQNKGKQSAALTFAQGVNPGIKGVLAKVLP